MPNEAFQPRQRTEEVSFDWGEEHFICRPRCTAGQLADLFDEIAEMGETRPSVAFVREMLVDDDSRERWDQAVHRDIDLPDVIDIVNYLVRVYAKRPPEPPAG